MKRIVKTEVVIEQDEILVVGKNGEPILGWCGDCRAEVNLASPETAAKIFGITPRAIYRLVEADRLHFSETALGNLQICLISLADNFSVNLIKKISSNNQNKGDNNSEKV
ncbi:MAG TPA: hypothetical protein VK892_18635 [Pyrinomonadaceae bacterium]|nr:hypothetical protein [Pyrinomonadaceae bacterium]